MIDLLLCELMVLDVEHSLVSELFLMKERFVCAEIHIFLISISLVLS